MTKKLLTSLLILTFLWGNEVYALDRSHTAAIESSGSKKYKAVRLVPEVYNNSSKDLSDLILYDKDHEEVPYFINSYIQETMESENSYEMDLTHSFVKDQDYYFDYSLKNPPTEDLVATSLEIQTEETGFAKQVELLGSHDGVHWEKVQDDMIYSVEDSKKLELTFDHVQKYTYYRLKLFNNLEKVVFPHVFLKYNNTIQKKELFAAVISPSFTVKEEDKTTVVKLQGLKNLKIDSVTIQTNSMFKRNVDFTGGQTKLLYNLVFQDTQYKDLTIPLNGWQANGDTTELHIYNKDDKPINITGIQVRYLLDELVFDGSKGGPFALRFGSSEVQERKSYDIESYKDLILKEGYDLLSIGQIKEDTAPEPAKQPADYKWVFNAVIVLIAVIMGAVIILKLKKQ